MRSGVKGFIKFIFEEKIGLIHRELFWDFSSPSFQWIEWEGEKTILSGSEVLFIRNNWRLTHPCP